MKHPNNKNSTFDDRPVEKKYTWNILSIFDSIEDWHVTYSHTIKRIESDPFSTFKSTLCNSPLSFASFMKEYESLERDLIRLYTFANLLYVTEMSNPTGHLLLNKITNLIQRFKQATFWMINDIVFAPEYLIKEIINDPSTKVYTKFIKCIKKRQAHTLSASEEAVFTASTKFMSAPETIHSRLTDVDIKFPDVKDSKKKKHALTKATYNGFMHSADRKLRKNAFMSMLGTLSQYKQTYASTLSAQMKIASYESMVHKHESPLLSSLFSKDVSEKVFFNLINTVKHHIPLLRRCIRHKKKMLKYKTMNEWDLFAPIPKPKEISNIQYETAVSMIINSIEPLGEKYTSASQKGLLQDRWVDVFPNVNKQSGAFSSGCYDTLPFIKMNYQNDLQSVFTLTHELGHSMHSLLTNSNQPYVYHDYTMVEAEVASNINEALLRVYLQNHYEENYNIAAKEMYIEEIISSVFKQVIYAEFEYWASEQEHRHNGLTSDSMHNKYLELHKEYFGNSISTSEYTGYTWQAVPHFFYDFYVFQYAIGFCAGVHIVNDLLSGSITSNDILLFLESGRSLDPVSLLKIVNIDLLSPHYIHKAFAIVKKSVGI